MTDHPPIDDADKAAFAQRLDAAREKESAVPDGVAWVPQPGSQVAFLSCPAHEVLLHGTRGSGKSDALLMSFAKHVGRGLGADWRGIIFRRTYPELADIIAKSEKWFRRIFPRARFNRSRTMWEFPDGEVLMFRHMMRHADIWYYQGHEYPFIGWEELTNWMDDGCYKPIMACNRSANPDVPKMIRSTTNPYGVGAGWIKERFQLAGQWMNTIVVDDAVDAVTGKPEKMRVAIHGHLRENLRLLEASPDYADTIDEAATNEAMASAWSEGNWDITVGGMFSDVWDPTYNIVGDFEIPRTWVVDRAFDWGSSKPFAVGWFAQSDGSDLRMKDGRVVSTVRGDLFHVAEWYGWSGRPNDGVRMLAVDVAKGIVERELLWGWRSGKGSRVQAGPADSAIYTVENGVCIAQDMEQPVRIDGRVYTGVQWVPSDKQAGSRKMGWEMMRKMIKRAHRENGLPRERPGFFAIGERVPQFLRTVISLPRDEKDLDDVDTDAEDHCVAGASMVVTPDGARRIDSIQESGVVLSPLGWAQYERCGMKARAAECVELTTAEGDRLICTPDHEILGPEGWFAAVDSLDMVSYDVRLCESRSSPTRSRNSTGNGTTCAGPTSSVRACGCIARYGSTTADESRRDRWFTTGIMIDRPTGSVICSSCGEAITPDTISKDETSPHHRRRQGGARLSGIGPMMVELGIGGTGKGFRALCSAGKQLNAVSAAGCSKAWRSDRSSARTSARRRGDVRQALTMKNATAMLVAQRFESTSIRRRGTARVDAHARVKRVRSVSNRDVYCLDVPGVGAFVLANGMVVANCADMVRYRIRGVGTEARSIRTVGMY